jgi:hypothetical protein
MADELSAAIGLLQCFVLRYDASHQNRDKKIEAVFYVGGQVEEHYASMR